LREKTQELNAYYGDQVRQKLLHYCLGPLGKRHVADISFKSDSEAILSLLSHNLEAKQILDRGEDLPVQSYDDPEIWFQTAAIEGNFLEGDSPALWRRLALQQRILASDSTERISRLNSQLVDV